MTLRRLNCGIVMSMAIRSSYAKILVDNPARLHGFKI